MLFRFENLFRLADERLALICHQQQASPGGRTVSAYPFKPGKLFSKREMRLSGRYFWADLFYDLCTVSVPTVFSCANPTEQRQRARIAVIKKNLLLHFFKKTNCC